MHYLRAQIARISASTHVCPLGYYTVDRREITQLEPSNVQPRVSSELNKISKARILLINFKGRHQTVSN